MRDRGEDFDQPLVELQQHVSYPHAGELFLGDYSADYIIDFSLNWRADWPKLTTDEMVILVTKMLHADGTQAELALSTLQFDANCVHPAKNELVYYPERHFFDNSDPSPAEIVEKAMSTVG